MAILRPQWRNVIRNDIGFSLPAGITNIFNITDGPGLIKGGGFEAENLAAANDVNLIITVDGNVILNKDLAFISPVLLVFQTGPWDAILTGGTKFNFDFKQNVQLGFTSSLKFDLDNTGSADTINLSHNVDYQRGA